MSGRVVFLLTSARVAPGLLAWPAWESLHAAHAVLTAVPEHQQRAPIEAAGVRVEVLDDRSEAGEAGAEPSPRQRAVRLVERAAGGETVVWLADADGDPELAEALAMELAGRSERGETGLPELEVLLASYDLPGAALVDLVAVMDRLRRECPWVRQQTHRSLVRYLIEEAYETVEAIESGDRAHLREELGDLLFQVVFHSRLAEEGGEGGPAGGTEAGEVEGPAAEPWSIDDVAADLTAKLIRRNPHVFGRDGKATFASARGATGRPGDRGTTDRPGEPSRGAGASGELGVAEIEAAWDALKAEEKARSSAVEGIPLALPALALAHKLIERTDKAPVDVPPPDFGQAVDRLAGGTGDASDAGHDEIGEALLALTAVAYRAGIDAEQALRDAVRRHIARVRAAEAERSSRPAEEERSAE